MAAVNVTVILMLSTVIFLMPGTLLLCGVTVAHLGMLPKPCAIVTEVPAGPKPVANAKLLSLMY